MGFFEKLKGCDDEITHEFSMALQSQGEDNATIFVKGISIHLNAELIIRVTNIPLGVNGGRKIE